MGNSKQHGKNNRSDLKWCPGCEEYKEKTEFCKNASRKDGLHPYCKECKKQHGKQPVNGPKDPI